MSSLWWQYSRSADKEPTSKNFFTFNATPIEAENKLFHLRYNCAADTYERLQPNAATGQLDVEHYYSKWQTCVYSRENIARKEEHNHRMVYLAKSDVPDAQEIIGLIEWQFDFSNKALKIKSAELTFGTMLYRDGKVDVDILHGDQRLLGIEDVRNWTVFPFVPNCKELKETWLIRMLKSSDKDSQTQLDFHSN